MTQEIKNTLPPQVETIFDVPPCSNIDELSADVAFLGIPYELGQRVTASSGQKWGPKAIRSESRCYQYRGYVYRDFQSIVLSSIAGEEGACGWFDPDAGEWRLRGVTMADCGDVNILPEGGQRNSDFITNCDRITEVVRRILDRGAFPVLIGGDHTIPVPVVRAFDSYYPLDIVQFDSHLDMFDSVAGVKVTGADCMARCSELPFVRNITHIGMNPRSRLTPARKEAYDAAVARGNTIITVKRFKELGVSQVVESIPEAKNIYGTIDLDVMDCSVVPAVYGQEVEGLTFSEVQQTLVGIPKRGKVVGFDVAEFLPARDLNGRTSRVVVNLIEDFLAAIFPSKR